MDTTISPEIVSSTIIDNVPKSYQLEEFEYSLENDDSTNNDCGQKDDTVENKIPELLKAFETNRIVFLTGDTGCGKTTKIPILLMDRFKTITCTQPRRLAVINTAKQISRQLKCPLGSVVGYKLRFENVTSQNTVLRIVTEGILLNEITNRSKTTNIDLIIIDEAHERTFNIDLLLGYFKNVMLKDESITTKVLIMSATLQTDKLIQYFNNDYSSLVEIKKQRRFKIDHFYLKDKHLKECRKNMVDYCALTALNIIKKNPDGGDILIFLPGQSEIQDTFSYLSFLCEENGICNEVKILKLFSLLPQDEQNLIFEKDILVRRRKIILSTNIAETSVTIENIKFIIDSGQVKIMNKSFGTQTLSTMNISKSQAKQRAGRVGRTQPGVVYRLFSQSFYDTEMKVDQEPELLRTDLSLIVLHLKKLGIGNIFEFEFIDKPDKYKMFSALQLLKCLGAISNNNNNNDEKEERLTKMGMKMADIPLDPKMSRTLHEANRIGCINSVSIIIAFLNHPQFFTIPKIRKDFDQVKETFEDPIKGDFYMFLNIYKAWEESHFSRKFINSNFLNYKIMLEIKKERNLLLNFYPKRRKTDNFKIEKAFCAGFCTNVAKRTDNTKYKILGDDSFQRYKIDKRDSLCIQNPPFILFHHAYTINSSIKILKFCLEIDKTLYKSCKKQVRNFTSLDDY